jgi:hypothetical protein
MAVGAGKGGTHLIKGRVTMKMSTGRAVPMLLAAGLGCAAVGSLPRRPNRCRM